MMFFAYALVGLLVASILVCIPALHTYNVVGLLLLLGYVSRDSIWP
jgi:hypothetical protein